MLVNQQDFNSKLNITDDWNTAHRIVWDLEALTASQSWQVELSLPDGYTIKEIHGGKITQEYGKIYVSGEDWNKDLNAGEKTEIVLIVNENSNSNSAPIPIQFLYADSTDNSLADESNSEELNSAVSLNSQIVEDWDGGYKLEAEISAQSDINNWEVDFSLPYTIKEVYGANLIDNGDGNYSINGQNDQQDLSKGQSIKPIFIIDDNGQSAMPLSSNVAASTSTYVASEDMPSEPEIGASNNTSESSVDSYTNEPTASQNDDIVAQADDGQKTIDVDNDFGGNLESAIAAANNGDVVQLGGNTYYTNGITIEKDITIDGQNGTVIDGGGTDKSIFSLTQNASGATIQDLEITNGNIGIYGYRASNLILQNLDINNIGVNQTIRDGQNNTGIILGHAEGLQLRNSTIHDVSRNGVSIGDTNGAAITDISVYNINLEAQHSQSHDAAGIKFFNTNDVLIKDSNFSKINANNIWNDTTNRTTIEGNTIENVGDRFLKPAFNDNVDISGIYNEKSSNSIVKNNKGTSIDEFKAFNATVFTTETMTLENNDFSRFELNTQDYWVNQSAEELIATTEDPDSANFSLFADEYYDQANIG